MALTPGEGSRTAARLCNLVGQHGADAGSARGRPAGTGTELPGAARRRWRG
nr:hypothetical protein [Kibdelosporangium sp. MJ126-NF4]CTQ90139.1 hypothetical protein [Kibdelosporangium sp. MJ126-NF4]